MLVDDDQYIEFSPAVLSVNTSNTNSTNAFSARSEETRTPGFALHCFNFQHNAYNFPTKGRKKAFGVT